MSHLTSEISSQFNMKTQLEDSITDKVQGAADNVLAAVETKVHDVILAAADSLVTPRAELVIRSVSASRVRNPSSVVLDPD